MSVNRVNFLAFIRAQRIYTQENGAVTLLSLSTGNLADNDTDIDTALAWSIATVSELINNFNAIDYELAVYNAAMHWLLLFGQAEIFECNRVSLNLWAMNPGFVQSTSDEGTSVSNLLPDYLASLSASDMELMKTQNGRTYMAIVSRYRDLINFS